MADTLMIVRAIDPHGFIRVNTPFVEAVGFDNAELAKLPFLEWIEPGDQALVHAMLSKKGGSCRVRHRTHNGDSVLLDLQVADHEEGVFILGRSVLDPDPSGLPKPDEEQTTVKGTLTMIAQIVEEQNPGFKCSILLIADGHFVSGAGPSLPDDYNEAIDGYAIGPTVGSCGTAIYWNVPVIVDDIQSDPLWVPFAALAQEAGVAACWSHPFTSTTGRVLGALALYSPAPRAPTSEQLGRLRAAARMTGLAVERGRAEEALRQQRKRELELEEQLRHAAKMEALGVLAGGVAHDFNNVMATILANAELAQELASSNPEVVGMLSDIILASQRAGEFCQQMLAYAGRGPLTISHIDLGELIRELSGLVRAALPKKATLEYLIPDVPIFVEGDKNQLHQVSMNLVTNAAEAMDDDSGHIVVSLELIHCDEAALHQLDPHAKLPAGQYVRWKVSDTGSGMDSETMARIFDPFFTTKFTGRGLGLAAVKGIVTKHRGLIQLESAVGAGTIFTILLPVGAGVQQELEKSPPTPSRQDERRCILLVDDEASLRTILRRRLQHQGYKVIEAADGEVAIELFRKQPNSIDCVLLDFGMPKLNGAEVYRELSAIRKDIPVVLMSGFSEQEVIARCGGTRLTAYLQKPITSARLLAALHSVMVDAKRAGV